MKIKKFFIDLKNEEKIPQRDKYVLMLFLGLAILPILIVPGWTTTEGFIISLFLFSFIPDYFFNVLDQNLFLSLYPFDMKSYGHLKRAGQFLTIVTPSFITNQIWLYEKDVI